MLLSAFTFFHVLLSLIGIGSGLVVFYYLLAAKRLTSWMNLFLYTTVATSATGFLFPFHGFLPSHAVGIVSLIVLAVAFAALRRYRASGDWGVACVVASLISLYLNVFVLVAQLFQKVPSLKAMAPTQTEPAFQIAQLVVLGLFIGFGSLATLRFRGGLREGTASAARMSL